jgi:hypothetical protein
MVLEILKSLLSKKPHGVNRRALKEGNNPSLEQNYHRFGKSK